MGTVTGNCPPKERCGLSQQYPSGVEQDKRKPTSPTRPGEVEPCRRDNGLLTRRDGPEIRYCPEFLRIELPFHAPLSDK